MRTGKRVSGRAGALSILIAFLAAPLLSCFSEHTTGVVSADAVCSLSIEQLKSGDAYVPIRGFEFQVDTLRVAVGTRVTWVNCEQPPADPHTVTSDNGVWNSPFIPVGGTFSRTFNTRGTFAYHCIPHPFMHGVIVVQ